MNYLNNLDWEHYYNWPNTINKMEGAGACGCFVVGANNQGKTFGIRCIAVNRYLTREDGRGRQFVEVCRIKDDIGKVAKSYCDKIVLLGIFPGYQMRSKGNEIQIRQCAKGSEQLADDKDNPEPWEVMGYVLSLKDFMQSKRMTFPDVGYILFDEVIIEWDNKDKKYLVDEWTKLERLCVAVWRERPDKRSEGRVFLLGNSVDIGCPYFAHLGVGIPEYGQRWCMGKTWLFDYVKPSDYRAEAVKKTIAYRLFHGADKSAMLNEFAQDNDNFIADKPQDALYSYAIVYRNNTFGVWYGHNWDIHISHRIPTDWEQRTVYAITTADNTPDYKLINRAHPKIKRLLTAYQSGNLYFSTPLVREAFLEVLRLFGLK